MSFQLRSVLEHRREDRSEVTEAAAPDRCRKTRHLKHKVHEMGSRQARGPEGRPRHGPPERQ